jgi:hypothetical protein
LEVLTGGSDGNEKSEIIVERESRDIEVGGGETALQFESLGGRIYLPVFGVLCCLLPNKERVNSIQRMN